jgi:ABC-type transporter Mla MlaB component
MANGTRIAFASAVTSGEKRGETAMLKITRIGGDADQTLKLEGKLLEPWVGEVLRAVAELNGHSSRIRLDLSAVSFVDSAGTELLRDLIRRGIVIAACSAFVAELMHE